MNRNSLFRGALVLCLLTTPLLAIADHHEDMDEHDGHSDAHHQGDRHHDPVQRAEKHLSGLEKKLNLTAEQQPAWKTYSNAVMARAQEKTTRRDEFKQERRELRDMDTASRLEKMSQWLRERADGLEQMAVDTRVFQQVLSAEQQAAFDQFWQKHAGRGKWRKG